MATWPMFNRIAKHYDQVNKWVSLGIDESWRRELVKKIPLSEAHCFVDLGTGTGDVIFSALAASTLNFKHIIGVDPAIAMLKQAELKLLKKGSARVEFKQGYAEHIEVDDQWATVVTMAFSIRNVENRPAALAEILRILKPGGTVLILEFGLPTSLVFRWIYLVYFRYFLPFIGGLLSGDKAAYTYLNTSVEQFPYGNVFKKELQSAGFRHVSFKSLTFGIAYLYQATK